MSRKRQTIIDTSQSGSLADSDSQEEFEHDTQADETDLDYRDDIDPSDSASATAEYSVNHSARNARHPSRQHSIQRPRQPTRYYSATAHTPPAGSLPPGEYLPAMSTQDSDLYGGYAPPPGARYPYDPRGAAYPQSAVGGPYAPPSHPGAYGAQMVPWGGQTANPFQPHSPYYEGHRHEMMPYQPPGFPVPYAAPGPHSANFGMTHHLNHVIYPAPPPPQTEVGVPVRGPTPAPPEERKPDPEFLKMKEQLEMMQLERKKAEEAQARAELEQRIRQEEERKIKDRMDAMREAQEVAKKEIELARIAAETAARERLEEARKAEEERRRMEAELRAQAAREERERIEKEKQAEAERAAEQAAALERAERAAREKYEAAKKAEEESKAEMARQKELIEIETKNKLLAEQKAAEEAKAAAELKAAEAAKAAEIEKETLRQQAIQEHEAKLAAEKKALAEAEQAAAAAKQQAHDEFVLKQAEEKKKAEEAAAAAEQAKKDAEELKAKILEEGKKAAEEEAKKQTGDDKEPIKFKDAVGRKYSFPWRLASKWRTMEGLINQAFVHIDSVGPHVLEGHYDLEGPEGELILKEIWDNTVQPGWQITMKMWPPDQHRPRHPTQIRMPPGLSPEQQREFINNNIRMRAPRDPRAFAMPGGGGGGGPMGRPPVPPFGNFMPGPHGPMPEGVEAVIPGRAKKDKGKKATKSSGWGLIFGAPPKKSSSSKKKGGK
ncbi:hypothetical protein N0V93_006852 [Gnomoniopsis smithogilvyi]|uniref:Ubiquitin-like domain-containing protein n=1 Tax=Gnomoniopsis smithogilvyi TaxID=1191159 RepID=A0A9W8YQ64_9PEZI|nr:hypothetical protein N0V93_006852 [Gnomoniopsis smithogilvyi]